MYQGKLYFLTLCVINIFVQGTQVFAQQASEIPQSTANIARPSYESLYWDMGIWLGIGMIEAHHDPRQGRILPTQALDESARDAIHGTHRSPLYTKTERRWRTYSDQMITALIGTSISLPIVQQDNMRKLIPISRTYALNNLASVSLKHLVGRKRPKAYSFSEVEQAGDNHMSFPSGHSANAFVAASIMQELTPNLPAGFHYAMYGLAGSVSIARVKADRHYFTDVFVGAAMGTLITKFVFSNHELCDKISFEHQPQGGMTPERYRLNVMLARF